MHTRPRPPFSVPRILGTALLTVCALTTLAAPALAQSAGTRFERAKAREVAARKQKAPTVASLRAIATAYEAIVRRYPSSGYADNALWQAALVLDLAHQRGGQARDREQSTRLLQWLTKEYPHSPLVKQARARLGAEPQRAAVTAAAGPTPAPPATPGPPATNTASATPAAVAAAAVPKSAASLPALAASAPSRPQPAAVTLTAVTHTPIPKGDRVTFELSREPVYTSERVARTNQLRLSLSDVGLSTEALDAVASLRGSLVQFVQISATKGGTDVVLQLNGQPRHSAFPLYDPYRLVVDVETEAPAAAQVQAPPPAAMPAVALKATPAATPGTSTSRLPAWASSPDALPSAPAPLPTSSTPPAEAFAASSPAPPASTSRGGYSLARQLGLGVSRIVIDPGHGGHDPGAIANGVTEAELVLDVALRLEKLLQDQPGFEVVLTRRTNDFIALEERTALANKETADLFLSIHANSSPQRDTRGIETYFLNFASNSHAEAVAARENASSVKAMRNLPQLVKAITTNNKLAESREFANIVQTSLLRQARTQNKSVKDLGVKQAPFVVLLGAEMPSVLAEIAFVTNRSDATLLKQPAYRQRIAQALRDAVLRYQSSLKKVTTVTASAEGR